MSDAGPYREPPTERVEYRVVFGYNENALSNALTKLAADGFRVVPGGTASGGESRGIWFLLQRTTSQ